MSDACPKCHLPKEESAWQCDGCGFAFSRDFEKVRADLESQLARSRTNVVVTIVVGVGIVGGLVFLATRGFIYVSVPLMLVVVGSIGHAIHKVSRLREHLRALDRRHVRLPKATVHSG